MSDSSTSEIEIFNIKPSLKAHWAGLLLGIITTLFGVGLLILLFIWLSVRAVSYRMTNERIFLKHGIFSKRVQETELFRIKDVSFSQGIIQRLLGVGNITIISSDQSTPDWTISGVNNPEQLKEMIRTAFRNSRKQEGVRMTEMN